MIVYDVTKRKTFESLSHWLDQILGTTTDNCVKYLLGNKIDLEKEREVTKEAGMDFLIKHSDTISQFYEVSALTTQGFDIFFNEFCQEVYDNNKKKVENRLNKNQKLFERNKKKTNKGCC